jgi:tetratricopeptide (TPR) repeat protein
MQCGEPAAAEEFYSSAVKIEPDNTRFLLHLGILYLEQNEFSKSEEVLRKVIELDPDHSDARLYIALGKRAGGEREDAKALLEVAEELDGQNANYKKWLGLLSLETGDLVAALEYTNNSIELDPLDISVYSQLGTICNEMDDFGLAEKSYAAGLKIDPDDMRCLAGLASTFIKLGKLDEAKREIIEANRKGGEEHPLVLAVSALLDSFAGQKQEALGKIERVLTTESSSLDILLVAHQLMVNLEEDEKAEEILETMQSLAPDDARVMTALLG